MFIGSGPLLMARLWIGPATVLPAATRLERRCFTDTVFLVLLVGFSRIALGAHFLTDVLAAIVFGIVWLMLCMVLRKPIRRRNLRPEVIIPLANPGEALLAPIVAETLPGPSLEA
ncbi:MAG: hypothetical protein DMF10_05660 [Verrucomicrobia bacterium]|nr:MAG: hypothetical protein DMF10_05660 [Verrucomicrobiota bacterium]